jgi:hypothetical protein
MLCNALFAAPATRLRSCKVQRHVCAICCTSTIIEQVHADLKASALAHLPSGRFTANSAWLVLAVITFNLTRAAAALTEAPELVRATTATVRRKLIHVPARVASSARRITLHLPHAWPWQQAWTPLFDRVADPPVTAST